MEMYLFAHGDKQQLTTMIMVAEFLYLYSQNWHSAWKVIVLAPLILCNFLDKLNYIDRDLIIWDTGLTLIVCHENY